MTTTKKDLLTNIIIEKCKTLASIDITKKDEVMLSDFIKKNGYNFTGATVIFSSLLIGIKRNIYRPMMTYPFKELVFMYWILITLKIYLIGRDWHSILK